MSWSSVFWIASSSAKSWNTVGTALGSKFSIISKSRGTQTRPVAGWTQKGAFRRWFRCFETSASRRGYVYCRMMSSSAVLRVFFDQFSLLSHFIWQKKWLTLCADISLKQSDHLSSDERPGLDSHLERSVFARLESGIAFSSSSYPSSLLKHSWVRRIKSTKPSLRKSRASLTFSVSETTSQI